MNEGSPNTKSVDKMRRYYRGMLGTIASYYHINSDDIHDAMKCGYNNNQSTTLLSHDEYYIYLDNVVYFAMCIFDMGFDSDYYKGSGKKFVRMFGSMRPDYIKPSNYSLLF